LYSTLVTQNDVLLRSGLDAEDLVLSTQNTFGSIRFGTTRALTQPGAVTDLERMTILNDGNVGIGTMNPFYSAFATPLPIQSLLQVGNISINPVTFEGAIRRRGSIAFNSFNDPLTGIPKSVESGPVNGITFIPSEGTENLLNGGVRLFASNTVAANTAYDNLGTLTLKPGALELESQLGLLMRYKFPVGTVQTYNDDATLYIKDKVYIGAEEMLEGVHPPFDEDGFYKLAVKGSILASEIVVDGRPEMWPDYVFEASYELLPIEHLANKVRSEKHLPGIPSAVEIGKSGITLGEMQGKLLKKIEELTLYVIQLNEENKALSQRLQHLEKSN